MKIFLTSDRALSFNITENARYLTNSDALEALGFKEPLENMFIYTGLEATL